MKIFLTVFLAFVAAVNVSASGNNFLDASFANNGIATFSLMKNATGNGGSKAIITPDGKIFQFGGTASQPNIGYASIVKLDQHGRLDQSFGTGGIVVSNYPGLWFSKFYTGTIQTDGKIVAIGAGYTGSVNDGTPYSLIARFLPDGSVDTSFGTNGINLTRVSGFQVNYYWAAVVADDRTGKITVAGALDYQMAVARFNADGSPDASFGTNGYRLIPVALLGELWAMKQLTDGSVIVGGKVFTNYNDSNFTDYVLAMLTPNGALDTSFDGDGIRRFDLTPETESDTEGIDQIHLQPDGKILTVGRVGDSFPDALVMRFLPNGAFDTSFANNGIARVDYNNGWSNVATDMAVQSNGKIVLSSVANQNFLVQRLLPSGAMDTDFGKSGSVETDIGGRDRPYSVSVTADKIIVAGYGLGLNGIIRHFAVARYHQSNQPTGSVAGRVVNLLGRGIPNAELKLKRQSDNSLQGYVFTDSEGNYQISGAIPGEQYRLEAFAPRCYFRQQSREFAFDPGDTHTFRANCFRLIK